METKISALSSLMGVILVWIVPDWVWLIISGLATGFFIFIGQALARLAVGKLLPRISKWIQKYLSKWEN